MASNFPDLPPSTPAKEVDGQSILINDGTLADERTSYQALARIVGLNIYTGLMKPSEIKDGAGRKSSDSNSESVIFFRHKWNELSTR